MEKLQFDSGVKSYRINGGGVLRFHPGDPNLYSRFLEAVEKFKALEQELAAKCGAEETLGADILRFLEEADSKMKQLLNWIFGGDNDFHKLLDGVNLLAVADNGERVITNLLQALEPVLLEGAKRCADQQAKAAVEKANARRGQQ